VNVGQPRVAYTVSPWLENSGWGALSRKPCAVAKAEPESTRHRRSCFAQAGCGQEPSFVTRRQIAGLRSLAHLSGQPRASLSPVRQNQRDVGLIRVVGTWALAAGAIGMIVGAGIFAVPAALAASIGPYGPLALLACGFAVGAVAICFAEGCSRLPTSGGVYGLIEAALGPLVAYVSGTLLWVSCVLACGGVGAALADVVSSVVPQSLRAPTHLATIIGVIGSIALINVAGVARGARLVGATTMLKLVPLVIFVVVGLSAAVHGSSLQQTVHPNVQDIGRALILGVFAFIGVETPLCASGEVRQPNRTIPRAVGIAMLTTTILYVAVQFVAQGILGAALGSSKAPLADAMARIHPALRALMLAGAALSMFGYLSSDILGSPRQLFALARDELLPSALGRLHPRSHAPHIAILCYATLAMVFALTGTFSELAALATLAMAPLYIAGCAAAWVLARRGVALAGPPLSFRFLGIAGAIGISSMLVLIVLASRREIIGLVTLIVVSTGFYLLKARGSLIRA
jgi:APA family basic amino acid/polyamine antiporter